MKIILNSDILYHPQLIKEDLSRKLQELFKVCVERNYIIVIPETALLEFNRYQLLKKQDEVYQITRAYSILEKYGIQFNFVEPNNLVKQPDLIELIRNKGVNVINEVPILEDYIEAHRRACLHECPHPPDIKSDEMRDLVIWMIALRISSKDDGALLISNDVCHFHARGDSEAAQIKLVRVKNIEEALEYLDVETPVGKLMAKLLTPFWKQLIEEGLPLNKDMTIMGVSKARFIQGIRGIDYATCHFKAKTNDGKILSAKTEIATVDEKTEEIILSNIEIDNKLFERPKITMKIIKTLEIEFDDYEERYGALKNIIGDNHES